MKRNLTRWLALGVCVSACQLLGCAVAADIFNPGLLSSVGLDPAALTPSRGSIIITFTNNLTTQAVFYSVVATNANDLAADSRVISTLVDPGQTVNEVVECPVGVFFPGQLTDAFARDPAALTVVGGDGNGSDVNYDNAPLISNRDFNCGDLIAISANATGGGDQNGVAIAIRIIPGR